MTIDIRTYLNSSKIPDGRYQNHDAIHNKFFLKINGDDLHIVFDITELGGEQVSRGIYFSPSLFPRTGRYTVGGCCFADWVIPSAAYIFVMTSTSNR